MSIEGNQQIVPNIFLNAFGERLKAWRAHVEDISFLFHFICFTAINPSKTFELKKESHLDYDFDIRAQAVEIQV